MDKDLQFDRAEFSSPTAGTATCGVCKEPLRDSYFQANGKVLCAACAEKIRRFAAGDGNFALRFATAILFGLGAAALGSVIYFVVLTQFHINAALVTILIGYMVGKAVRKASGGLGGMPYQVLAAFLTYTAIAAVYFPLVEQDSPISMLINLYAAPVSVDRSGLGGILNLAIIFFGLMQAWRYTKRVQIDVTGPHALGTRGPQPSTPTSV